MEDELWGKDELIKQIRDNWNNNNPAMNQKITTTTEKINDKEDERFGLWEEKLINGLDLPKKYKEQLKQNKDE